MRILADSNIPQVDYFFGRDNHIVLKPGREIVHADLQDVDILLVRAVTQVNEALLENTPVHFVGSVTSGMDHVDTTWLDKQRIAWSDASGCNARAVVEYVIAVFARLQKNNLLENKKLRAAVIGVGTIGKQVVAALESLGCEVLQCDPLRARLEPGYESYALDGISDVDLISLHTPLTCEGEFATHHLIGQDFLMRQKKNTVLVNASRGEVIACSKLQEYGQHLYWCLDVWENEPAIDFTVLQTTLIASPHIAGYSVQSKLRGIEMIYQAARKKNILPKNNLITYSYPVQEIQASKSADWADVVLQVFDPANITQEMKTNLCGDSGIGFDDMRKAFNKRYEFGFTHVSGVSSDVGKRLTQLGFVVI